MSAPVLVSIQVGRPRERRYDGPPDGQAAAWRSAFFKEPVAGPVVLGRTNLQGDEQADVQFHGGPDKAVNCYSADHYPAWRRELELPELPHGAFAENFTLAGLVETGVCIGDVFAIGPVRVQISQPRQPCWKMGRRWRMPALPATAIRNGRTGWYLRVLKEGMVEPGLAVTLLDRPHPEWSVARANEVLHHRKDDLEAAAALAACPALSDAWRTVLLRRVSRRGSP